MTTGARFASCDDPGHCVTCADAADAMRIVSLNADGSIGECVDDAGRRAEVMLGLVSDVRVGDAVLVHAGVALSMAAGPVGGTHS